MSVTLVHRLLYAAFALGISGVGPASHAAAEPFYADKIVRVLINFAPGGAADLEGRLFAKHLGRVIQGKPKVVATNMGGSGGMAGTNYLGHSAPKDGTMIGYLTGPGGRSVFNPRAFRVDFATYEIIGYLPGASIYFARTDLKPGLKRPADLVNVEEISVGGLAAGANKDLTARLTLDMLGVRYRYVPGYTGTGPARLALERNEVQFFSDGRASYSSNFEPTLVKDGVVIPLYYDPAYDGKNLYVHKPVADIPVKPFQEFYRELKGAYPAGQLWEAYLALLAVNTNLQRVIALPPGVPPAAGEALRAAVATLNRDRQFAEEAQQTFGFVPDFRTGPHIGEEVRRMLRVTPATKAFLQDYMTRRPN